MDMIDFFDTQYFKKIKLMLMMIGLWPFADVKSKFIRSFVICFTRFVVTFCQISKLFTKTQNDNSVDLFIFILLTISVWVTMLNAMLQTDDTKRILQGLNEHWKAHCNVEGEKDILRHHVREATRLTDFHLNFLYVVVIGSILVPFLNKILDFFMPLNESRPMELLIPGEYFIDTRQHYYLLMFSLILTLIVSAMITAATYNTIIYFSLYSAGMLAVLGYQLSHIPWKIRVRSNPDDHSEPYELNQIVKEHLNIVNMINILQKICQIPFTCALIEIILIVCLTGIEISSFPWRLECMKHALLFIGTLLVAFFVCHHPAQKIMDHSLRLIDQLYSGEWWEAPITQQKSVLLVMSRFSKPCVLNSAKLVVNGHETFVKYVKSCVSFYAMLSSLRK